jgi:multidrug efflux pump subunit AcrA (membrane-fusion protein)
MKLLVGIFVAGLLAACNGQATPDPSTLVPVVAGDAPVIADGHVAPDKSLSLAFVGGGQVGQVFFAQGDSVAAGDVLAVLDNTEALQSQIAAAEAQRTNTALEQAAAALERLSAEQALADLQASAAIVTAQAAYAVAQAQDALLKADKDLENIQNPVSERLTDAVAEAEQALVTAQQNAEKTDIGDLANALENAQDNLETKTNQLNDAISAQEQCPGCTTLFVNATGRHMELEDAQAEYDAALDALRIAELNYEQALTNTADAVEAAQEDLDDAVANLAAAQRGPDADRLALAQANQALAAANLADAQQLLAEVADGPDPDRVALAEARLTTADARVAAAAAALPAAEAALAAAQAALENAELRAPFAGTLADFDLEVGQQVAPGQPVATLADFSIWWIETDNLTETDVVRLRPGQAVTVVLDALPDHPLQGTVTDIDTVSAEKQGDVTYTVRIALTDTDPLMRWGMTAAVTFEK